MGHRCTPARRSHLHNLLARATDSRKLRIEPLEERALLTAVPYTDVGALGVTGLGYGASAWADYDADGRPDLLMTGRDSLDGPASTVLYHNDGPSGFHPVATDLPAVQEGAVAWGDYDNDGLPDILIAGRPGIGYDALTRVYHNDGEGRFHDIGASLTPVFWGTASWGDYDNDGRLDILLAGSVRFGSGVAKIYHNDGNGQFHDIAAGLGNGSCAYAAWVDYDNDGRLDVSVSGGSVSIYINDGNDTFHPATTSLTGLSGGPAEWADYNHDGRVDVLLPQGIYRNDGGGSFQAVCSLAGYNFDTVSWTDYNLDGQLDLLGFNNQVTLLKNSGNDRFSEVRVPYCPSRLGWCDTADYDGDGREDFIVSGYEQDGLWNMPAYFAFFRNDPSPTQADIGVNVRTFADNPWVLTDTVIAGDLLTYTITAFNRGPAEAVNVCLTDVLPAYATFQSARWLTGSGTISAPAIGENGPVGATIPFLNGIDSAQLQIVVQVSSNIPDAAQLDNTITVASDVPDPNLANNSVTVTTTSVSSPAPFETVGTTNLPQGFNEKMAWGDYDNDGLADVAISWITFDHSAPYDGPQSAHTAVYHNDGNGMFHDIQAGLTGTAEGSLAWGDYDSDGMLDLLVTGWSGDQTRDFTYVTRILHNDGNDRFRDIQAVIMVGGGYGTSSSWGDYDNDGRLDIVVNGLDNERYSAVVRIYHNDGNDQFHDIGANLPAGYWQGNWGDYDGDGRLDLLFVSPQTNGAANRCVAVYHNDGNGVFHDIEANLTPVISGAGDWGDYDSDGLLDLAITGMAGDATHITKVYHNDGNGQFRDIGLTFPGFSYGSVCWGDYDNDGRTDLLLSGAGGEYQSISVFHNDGNGTFHDAALQFANDQGAVATWWDEDGDSQLDILATGFQDDAILTLRNTLTTTNAPPEVPTGLAQEVLSPTSMSLSWTPPTDDHTPTAGLTYELRLTPTGQPSTSPAVTRTLSVNGLAATAFSGGQQNLPQQGSIQGTSYVITGLTPGENYNWSVRAIDGALASSRFAGDDPNLPLLSIYGASVAEGTSGTKNAVFTVRLSSACSETVTVDYVTQDGSATGGSDYQLTSGTVTFVPGERVKSITVPIIGDAIAEDNERFKVILLDPVQAAITQSSATVTIRNDDLPTMSIADATVGEGDGTAVFTVSLSTTGTSPVTVKYSTKSGTAVADEDFSAVTGTLTFAPGELSHTISIPITDDHVLEAAEKFSLVLASPSGARIVRGTGVCTLTDNEPLPEVFVNSVTATEGNLASTVSFTVSLSYSIPIAATVKYATADATAPAGKDYRAATGIVTFQPGETQKTVVVGITGDLLDEDDETFSLNLSSPVNAVLQTSTGTATILDDDATPAITIQDVAVIEPDTGVKAIIFSVVIPVASGRPITVDYATSDGTALAGIDYQAASGTITIAPGIKKQTITVWVQGDVLYEANETLTVQLGNAQNATIARSVATGTIKNDDTKPAITVGDVTIDESAGTASFAVTLRKPSGLPATVNYATANGTAIAGSDYTACSGVLTFSPGATTQTVTVPINDDMLDEVNETFKLLLSGATGATIARTAARATIVDNDAAPAISIGDVSVIEGNSGTALATFTISLSAASARTVTVRYASAGGSGISNIDFRPVLGVLTFVPGQTEKTVTIPIISNTKDQADRTFLLNLTSPFNATLGRNSATGTILDDDPPPVISMAEALSISEGNLGTKTLSLVVSLSNASGQTVAVDYETIDGSATAGTDYRAATGTLVFAPGTTARTITVVVNGDTISELDETFQVRLSNVVSASLLHDLALATITNDDPWLR